MCLYLFTTEQTGSIILFFSHYYIDFQIAPLEFRWSSVMVTPVRGLLAPPTPWQCVELTSVAAAQQSGI